MEKHLIFIHLPSRSTRHQERTLGKELLKIIKKYHQPHLVCSPIMVGDIVLVKKNEAALNRAWKQRARADKFASALIKRCERA